MPGVDGSGEALNSQVFLSVRRMFGVDESEYLRSFQGQQNNLANMSESSTEGKSSSWFFFTEDRKYMIKTLEVDEAELLISILPDYQKHMTQHRDSLLTRFMG
jgi:1-phosphatidylinositol-4-phosphate 5-kinase